MSLKLSSEMVKFETDVTQIEFEMVEFETDVSSRSKWKSVQTPHPSLFQFCGRRRLGGGPTARPPKAAEVDQPEARVAATGAAAAAAATKIEIFDVPVTIFW